MPVPAVIVLPVVVHAVVPFAAPELNVCSVTVPPLVLDHQCLSLAVPAFVTQAKNSAPNPVGAVQLSDADAAYPANPVSVDVCTYLIDGVPNEIVPTFPIHLLEMNVCVSL